MESKLKLVKGKTKPVHSKADYYRFLMRALQVLKTFDRVGLAIMGNVAFGSVSRVISTLENVGAISKVGTAIYKRSELAKNRDVHTILNYSDMEVEDVKSVSYQKTSIWPAVLKEWDGFLATIAKAPEARQRVFEGMESPFKKPRPRR
jgi:hypothetical protein